MSEIRGLLLIMVAAGLSFQQQADVSVDTSRLKDTYMIYSALMANPPLARGNPDSIYLIEEATASGSTLSGDPPRPCIEPPAEYEERWREILAEFDARKSNVETLQRSLEIARPYVLLSRNEAKELIDNKGRISPRPQDPRFQGASVVYQMGNVYFSRDRTLALTSISMVCGSLCGTGGWRVFEKTAEGWVQVTRRKGPITCGDWVA